LIRIKTTQEIAYMREAGRIVAMVHQLMRDLTAPGVSTRYLDQKAEELIRSQGAIPSFKGYGGFPGSICVSVNDEVVHGIPGPRLLASGDIVSIDVGACIHGYHGDAALTLPVGEVSPEVMHLLRITEESLHLGIRQAVPGARLGDVSHAIQSHCEREGFSVVREYVGHGIGRELHEDPQVPNYGPPNRGIRLQSGMALAIEPMINLGKARIRLLDDGWTVKTFDGKPSAHFEHTIVITEDGPEIMTRLE